MRRITISEFRDQFDECCHITEHEKLIITENGCDLLNIVFLTKNGQEVVKITSLSNNRRKILKLLFSVLFEDMNEIRFDSPKE